MKLIPLRQVQFPVLIETYWNVNFDAFLLVSAMDAPVLIETYWNVKDLPGTYVFKIWLCINRNLLEYKDI